MRKVFIIGTNHVYQFGSGSDFKGTTCSQQQEAKFRQLLIKVCGSCCVAAICEELSEEALRKMALTESVPKKIAHALSLCHRYCDPNEKERNKMGIRDDSYIRTAGIMSHQSQESIEQEVLAERRKREPYWIGQLLKLDAYPVLFVCGSWHVPSFSDLLRHSGAESIIVERDWAPNP